MKPDGGRGPASRYWIFLKQHPSLLGYGILLTLASSFGQTFFISLFVPSLLLEFGLSAAAFGSLYALATLGSALLLPAAGRGIDHIPLSRYTLLVLAGLCASALLLASAGSVFVLGLSLLGLRLAGQGLSPHTGLTAMARYVPASRGKALSIASLGFPLGEGTLPLLVAGLLNVAGWRTGWFLSAGVVAAVFLPLSVRWLRTSEIELDPRKIVRLPYEEEGGQTATSGRPTSNRHWTLSEVLRDGRFWLLLPASLLPPFWATGLILYQAPIAQIKGWSLTGMASAFVAYAVARIVSSLAVGGAIDRWSARVLFPAAVLPMGVGVVFLDVFTGLWAAFAYLGLLGTTTGLNSNLKTALWAELYGIRHLGAVKSLGTGMMVLSTAAAPLVVGVAVEQPDLVPALLRSAVVSVVVGSTLALIAVRQRRAHP